MSDYIPVTMIDEQKLLVESETFCMYPWVHIYKSPMNQPGPCCMNFQDVVESDRLDDYVNSDYLKDIRLKMLNNEKHERCNNCYVIETFGESPRQSKNREYQKYFHDSVKYTRTDGTLDNFKMRHFDIRFSNVCNFKCRSCGPEFSSQWGAELKKADTFKPMHFDGHKFVAKDVDLMDDIKEHIQYIEEAYFAGGEPLTSEPHFVLLEEFVRQGRTDIRIAYNTNLSKLDFKHYDLFGLWNQFSYPIDIRASIDHVDPEKASYIRSGTVWEEIDKNITRVMENDMAINFHLLISIYNILDIEEIVDYFIEKLSPQNVPQSVNDEGHPWGWKIELVFAMLTNPSCLSASLIAPKYRSDIIAGIERAKLKLAQHPQTQINSINLDEIIKFLNEAPDDSHLIPEMLEFNRQIDSNRNEDLASTFPKLWQILND